ncbi:MAG: rane-bound serine protease, partial [Deltaproteobacteria bacterium]|nr:rane-bound serine protease [Deltaproteobacteria bacterium]
MTKKSLIFSFFLSFLLISALFAPAEAQEKHAAVIKINDVITPAIADFISRSIEQATKEKAVCLIIQMDTPGGLDLSMRDIIKDIMNAEIPVIVYVGPSGARAASAGAIITIAADIAAMAPSTNIGAAHPVAVGGGKMDRTMAEKVVNDAVAYVKSIAQKKGRNVDWAVRAVRDSVSIPETEALKLKVIDLIAKDLNELLEKIDGKTVEKPKGAIKLATKGLKIQELEMGFRQRFLATLSNPNI